MLRTCIFHTILLSRTNILWTLPIHGPRIDRTLYTINGGIISTVGTIGFGLGLTDEQLQKGERIPLKHILSV